MSQLDDKYQELRDVWGDYNRRQEFQHELSDRKTTWLLQTQAILFAAYGLTFRTGNAEGRDDFRVVVAVTGLVIAVVIFVGMFAIVRAKYVSWRRYRAYFESTARPLPEPFASEPLKWGVDARYTAGALAPDLALPVVFVVACCVVLLL